MRNLPRPTDIIDLSTDRMTLSLAAAFIKKFLNNFCTFATRGGGVNKKLKRL